MMSCWAMNCACCGELSLIRASDSRVKMGAGVSVLEVAVDMRFTHSTVRNT